jgi:hypothetical protein
MSVEYWLTNPVTRRIEASPNRNIAVFVKIDIEGAEILALEGCKDQERWMHSVFVVECHNAYRKVHEHLLRLRKEIRVIKHPLFGAHPGHCWMIGVPSR